MRIDSGFDNLQGIALLSGPEVMEKIRNRKRYWYIVVEVSIEEFEEEIRRFKMATTLVSDGMFTIHQLRDRFIGHQTGCGLVITFLMEFADEADFIKFIG